MELERFSEKHSMKHLKIHLEGHLERRLEGHSEEHLVYYPRRVRSVELRWKRGCQV